MKDRLTDVNMFSFIISAMIGIRLLTLPRDIAKFADNNSWVSVLVMGSLAYLMGYIFYYLGVRYPLNNFSQILEKVFGTLIGKMIQIGIAIYTISSIGLGLRNVSDGIKMYLLDSTPRFWIMLLMIVAFVYALKNGVKTISTLADMFVPFVLLFLFLLIIASIKAADPGNLLPVFHGGFMPIFQGSVKMIDPFLTVGIIGYVLPNFIEPKKTKKWIFFAISVSIICYLGIVTMCIMVFGSEELHYLIYPTLTLAKNIKVDIQVFERIESLFMAVWIPISFTTLLQFYFVSTLNLKALFNCKKSSIIIIVQLLLFFPLALKIESVTKLFLYFKYVEWLALFLGFVVLPLAFIIEWIKGRSKNREQW
ncbi:spore germination protein [Bacillus timonensis]|nr:spore germination protein [Bacillus timonensis]